MNVFTDMILFLLMYFLFQQWHVGDEILFKKTQTLSVFGKIVKATAEEKHDHPIGTMKVSVTDDSGNESFSWVNPKDFQQLWKVNNFFLFFYVIS
jgi:hypothetical protein